MKATLLLLALIAGCSYPVSPAEWELAVKDCEPHNGLRYARPLGSRKGGLTMVCNDGVVIEHELRR